MLNSRLGLFSAALFRAPLLPKLRGQLAEFLNNPSPVGCSAPKGGTSDAVTGDSEIAALISEKPSNAEEAAELFKKLMQKENEIFSNDSALWEKVFLAADKDMPMIEDGKNYGDFLLDTIEGAKDQFAADELKTLKFPRKVSW